MSTIGVINGSTISSSGLAGMHGTVVRSRLRLTRRGRMVFTTLAALPVLVVVAVVGLNGGQASAGNTSADVHFQTVTVEPGETLWQLAEETAPNADPRDFVQDVVNLNALDGSGVQAGEQLAIPTKYADTK
ncbi:LysM peptidoglycan-binding domain-containing protein [Curtobacterium sp. VKM Ac-1395]|uniref:LysM peptidoglycan-binding domain-containing protein n=1 Tax=Curtobacterium sp. VKM Ac-1395 TaxID=2783815 RepID=UPI001E48BCF6|nr:LysM peptidoglycan-binding domain-containing protein [Curtobacterium sp. VKM Ac-1395]